MTSTPIDHHRSATERDEPHHRLNSANLAAFERTMTDAAAKPSPVTSSRPPAGAGGGAGREARRPVGVGSVGGSPAETPDRAGWQPRSERGSISSPGTSDTGGTDWSSRRPSSATSITDGSTAAPDAPGSVSLAVVVAARRAKDRRAMQERLRQEATRPMSREEAAVAASFVHPDHLRAIAQATKQGGFAVSFRPAGELTLRRIGEGAPTKGHDILEKTIKPGSVRDGTGARDPARMAALGKAGIDGYVGHWNGGRLVGLHVDPAASRLATSGKPEERQLAAALRPTGTGGLYYPLDEDRLDDSLRTLKDVPGWQALPFTGDYDTHDLISMQGRRSPVSSGSNEEQRLISRLNEGIATADPQRSTDKPHHVPVQHGSQHNYVAFSRNEEKDRALVAGVARPEFPIAMCDRGNWSIIESEEGLKKVYSDHGMTLKNTWTRTGGMALMDTSPTTVALRRVSVSSDVDSSG